MKKDRDEKHIFEENLNFIDFEWRHHRTILDRRYYGAVGNHLSPTQLMGAGVRGLSVGCGKHR